MTKENLDNVLIPQPNNKRRNILIVVLSLIVISVISYFYTTNHSSTSDKSDKVQNYITKLKNKNKTVKLKEEFGNDLSELTISNANFSNVDFSNMNL